MLEQYFLRLINAACILLQVLGNVQKRRMYDKGGLYETGTADMTETTEQAAVSKFYKSRGQTYTGKTPIYDYDEWSKNHYGKMFERREKAKARYTAQVCLISFQTDLNSNQDTFVYRKPRKWSIEMLDSQLLCQFC